MWGAPLYGPALDYQGDMKLRISTCPLQTADLWVPLLQAPAAFTEGTEINTSFTRFPLSFIQEISNEGRGLWGCHPLSAAHQAGSVTVNAGVSHLFPSSYFFIQGTASGGPPPHPPHPPISAIHSIPSALCVMFPHHFLQNLCYCIIRKSLAL